MGMKGSREHELDVGRQLFNAHDFEDERLVFCAALCLFRVELEVLDSCYDGCGGVSVEEGLGAWCHGDGAWGLRKKAQKTRKFVGIYGLFLRILGSWRQSVYPPATRGNAVS